MDKNSYIGLGIIAAMLIVYFQFFAPETPEVVVEPEAVTVVDSNTAVVSPDTTLSTSDTAPQTTLEAVGELITVETEDLIIKFNTIGAQVAEVELKNYKTSAGEKLLLLDNTNHKLTVNAGDLEVSKLAYVASVSKDQVVKKDDSLTLTFSSPKATISYLIAGSGYIIGSDIKTAGDALSYNWSNALKEVEFDSKQSLQHSGLHYYTDEEDFEDFGDGSGLDTERPEEKIRWISGKQRFFNTAFISEKNPFTNASLTSNTEDIAEGIFKQLDAEFELPLINGQASYRMYVGPNVYDDLADVTDGFEKNVYLGWAIFAYVNQYVTFPIFNFLEGFISNYGLLILVLVFIIKLLLFPIAYKSYLSMAKMKELKPEIDEIKKRLGEDKQTEVQQETMKLYNKVGVNPLAGCIPMVLQMPVLFALFNFFPNIIQLRGKPFLWAPDLSTFDHLISWSGEVLWMEHISIFTLLMTISTVAYTYYNNQINAQATGPMKYMGYMMPVVFFFVLNDYAAGLTFYYFVSNLITISQQLLATNFIDKDKIRAKLEENRKSSETGTKKTSKFQQRLQDAMKAQQAAKTK